MKQICKKCFLLLVILGISVTGCGKKAVVKEGYSPVVEMVQIYSKNSNTEDSQQVRISLFFDKKIKVHENLKDSICVKIAGNRIKKESYVIQQSENKKRVDIEIPTTAVTTGVLEIEGSEKSDVMGVFTDESNKYAVSNFTVEGIIPCGVMLQDVKDDNGQILKGRKQVVSPFAIRSIGWIELLEDGKPIVSTVAPEPERMEQAVAVHGHEFLRDGTEEVAQNIANTLNKYFSDQYEIQCEGDEVFYQKKGGNSEENLDIQFYTYLKLNGEDIIPDKKVKDVAVMSKDRTSNNEDKKILSALHLTYKNDENSEYGSGDFLYDTICITGKGIGEEQYYSVLDFESVIKQSLENQKLYDLNLVVCAKQGKDSNGQSHDFIGIDFSKFLKLCKIEDAQEISNFKITYDNGNKEELFPASEILDLDKQTILATGMDDMPIIEEQCLSLVLPDERILHGVSKIIADETKQPKDPNYRMHAFNDPYKKSNDISFEMNVIKNDEKIKSAVITTKELEELAISHPDKVIRSYYGVHGNTESFPTMGAGGWLDYFEGINLYWLMEQMVGIPQNPAKLVFYDRDLKEFARIESIDYLKEAKAPEEYYVLDREGTKIKGALPMLGYAKNGYPLLAEHNHECPEFVAYNHFHHALEEMGIKIEQGVVKNHNGPFIAGLGNKDGIYGGNQKETGGDCIRLDIVYN